MTDHTHSPFKKLWNWLSRILLKKGYEELNQKKKKKSYQEKIVINQTKIQGCGKEKESCMVATS